MCGSLCDELLDAKDSARTARGDREVEPLFRPARRVLEWYRYHRQFRAVLRAELERREPELIPALNRRAAHWCQANGAPEAAISYAHAAGDVDLVARLVAPRVLPAWSAGHSAMVETWLGWFEDTAGLERHPAVAVLGAWVHALKGRTAECERWLGIAARSTVEEAPPDGSASIRPWIAVVRAAMCRDGPEQMRADAELALRELGPASRWRPTAMLLRGGAELLLGDIGRSEASMADAAEVAESMGATPTLIAALAERSLLMANRGDKERAAPLAKQARDWSTRTGSRGTPEARSLLRRPLAAIASGTSTWPGRNWRERARSGRGSPTRFPGSPCTRALSSPAPRWRSSTSPAPEPGSRTPTRSCGVGPTSACSPGSCVRSSPKLDRVAKAQEGKVFALTAAELRLLPFLATHLSFREIGEHRTSLATR